jgi:hypothetical protein
LRVAVVQEGAKISVGEFQRRHWLLSLKQT